MGDIIPKKGDVIHLWRDISIWGAGLFDFLLSLNW
jgi:hypothetical protein